MRSISRYAKGLFKKNNWTGLINSFYVYANWFDDYFIRYVLGLGSYPKDIKLRTPCGEVLLEVNFHEDLFTITEIFAMQCYKSSQSIRTFVDFGGNIGIASAYFLTRNTTSRGIIFEPLENNLSVLKKNLRHYSDRVEVIPKAIWINSDLVDFGVEESGRYCGINLEHNIQLKVQALNINEAIEYCISKFQDIDILKIDIEGAGAMVLSQMKSKNLNNIHQIMIEEEAFDDRFLLEKNYRKYIFDSNGLYHYKRLKNNTPLK
jgi:FkbM family methyltransferase